MEMLFRRGAAVTVALLCGSLAAVVQQAWGETSSESSAASLISRMQSDPSLDPWSPAPPAGTTGGARRAPAAAARSALPELSSDCNTAQAQGSEFARRLAHDAASGGPSVCNAARRNKLLGELQIQVAQRCKNIPTWVQLQSAGQEMVQQSNRTIAGSCQ
jgi:hypothetical protein